MTTTLNDADLRAAILKHLTTRKEWSPRKDDENRVPDDTICLRDEELRRLIGGYSLSSRPAINQYRRVMAAMVKAREIVEIPAGKPHPCHGYPYREHTDQRQTHYEVPAARKKLLHFLSVGQRTFDPTNPEHRNLVKSIIVDTLDAKGHGGFFDVAALAYRAEERMKATPHFFELPMYWGTDRRPAPESSPFGTAFPDILAELVAAKKVRHVDGDEMIQLVDVVVRNWRGSGRSPNYNADAWCSPAWLRKEQREQREHQAHQAVNRRIMASAVKRLGLDDEEVVIHPYNVLIYGRELDALADRYDALKRELRAAKKAAKKAAQP